MLSSLFWKHHVLLKHQQQQYVRRMVLVSIKNMNWDGLPEQPTSRCHNGGCRNFSHYSFKDNDYPINDGNNYNYNSTTRRQNNNNNYYYGNDNDFHYNNGSNNSQGRYKQHHHRRGRQQEQEQQKYKTNENNNNDRRQQRRHVRMPTLSYAQRKDETLPYSQHFQNNHNQNQNKMFAESSWIRVVGALPFSDLDEVVATFENIIQKEIDERGIPDLDAPWNPVQDASVPMIPSSSSMNKGSVDNSDTDQDISSFYMVHAAHVMLSPFGRPMGWYIKFANRSIANAILVHDKEEHIYVAWKKVDCMEHDYTIEDEMKQNYGLIVNDSMIRVENCPPNMTMTNIRNLFTRYELATDTTDLPTVIRWDGNIITHDQKDHIDDHDTTTAAAGAAAANSTKKKKKPWPTYIVRFASPAWARAAVRDLQGIVPATTTLDEEEDNDHHHHHDDDDDDDDDHDHHDDHDTKKRRFKKKNSRRRNSPVVGKYVSRKRQIMTLIPFPKQLRYRSKEEGI